MKHNISKKIWIVEDDEGISEVTSLILSENGYISEMIRNEETLFRKIKEELPSLILLDIFLYNANGIDIAKKLKSKDQTRNIPIIIMSADTQIEKKVHDAGVEDFIKKPFELKEFIEKVEKFFNSKVELNS